MASTTHRGEQTGAKLRVSTFWLGVLRRLMGLRVGEHVIVLTVAADGQRRFQVATLPGAEIVAVDKS